MENYLYKCAAKLIITVFFTVNVTYVLAQSGTVFRDFNNNGIRDKGESGVAGITVQSFKSGSVVFGTAVTNAQGAVYPVAGPCCQ